MRTKRTLRAPAIAAGVLTLATPATAFALGSNAAAGSPAPAGASVHVDSLTGRVPYGARLTVRGEVPSADAGQRLAVEFEPAGRGAWRTLATTRAGAMGRFTARVPMHRSGMLRVVPTATAHAATASAGAASTSSAAGSATPAIGASAPARIRVGASFRIGVPNRDGVAGQPVAIRGRLLPGARGRLVRLVTRSGRGWRTVATGRTGARGAFQLRYPAPAGATQWLRVSFGGDAGNARAWARAGNVTGLMYRVASWYDDGGQTACGFHATYGVANKTLPCGTKVTIAYGGRSVVATVDDRGPFVPGRDYDLNQNVAGALGMHAVATVLASR